MNFSDNSSLVITEIELEDTEFSCLTSVLSFPPDAIFKNSWILKKKNMKHINKLLHMQYTGIVNLDIRLLFLCKL